MSGPVQTCELCGRVQAVAQDVLEHLNEWLAEAWDRGASEGLRTPASLGYMLANPYRGVA